MLASAPMALAGAYHININSSEGGSVSVSKMSGTADAGEFIRVFIRPESNLWTLHSFSITRQDDGTVVEYADYYDPNYQAYSFTMPAADVTITASFARVFYAVTVSPSTEEGSALANVDHAATGDEVVVNVYPADGFHAVGLQVKEDDTGEYLTATKIGNNLYTFTIGSDDVTVTPLFAPTPKYPVYVAETEHGSIDVEERGYEGDAVFFHTYPDRGYATESVNVVASTSQFASLPVEVTKFDEGSYAFIMPECNSVTIYATFKLADYHVKNDPNMKNGTVSEDIPNMSHHFDETVTLTVTPDEDYVLNHLTITDDNGDDLPYAWVTEGESLRFTMPYSNVTVHASFRYTVYAIEILDIEHGTVTADVDMARVGDTVTITVAPDLGYMLTNLTVEAGYEITGGGTPHAPRKAQGLWYTQEVIGTRQIDDTHFSFVLPDWLMDNITPNYLEATKFRITATFKDLGPRVMWCQGNNTLYFDFVANPTGEPQVGDTYDGQTITALWVGERALPTYGIPFWNTGDTEQATRVVFSPDFAQARPTSCYYWFYYFKSLENIEGLENLNTSEVIDMRSMFDNCWSLTTINVNSFDVSKVIRANKMFFDCISLTTIYCDNTWDIENDASMFTYDSHLVGAVAYRDKGIDDGSMANPTTGYFTSSHLVTLVVEGDGTADVPQIGFPGTTITVTPAPGQFSDLANVAVTGDVSGNTVDVTAAGGAYTFTMPGEPVTVTVTFATPDVVDAVLWCEDNTTLYFVHQPVEALNGGLWDGQSITNMWRDDAVTNVGWTVPEWKSVKTVATNVVFDESFADARPRSCYSWFFEFKVLENIEGLEYLNTSEVTNMNSMFLNCETLTTLDVNTFDMSKVTNATSMFRSCTGLTTIYCDNTWSIATAPSMFLADINLVGAVAYESGSTTGAMANPSTGYFTGRWDVAIPSDLEHGTVACEKTWAYTNEMVTLTVTPDFGYELESLTIATVDAGEPAGAPTMAPRRVGVDFNEGDTPGTYTFKMPASAVAVSAAFTQSVITGVDDLNAAKQTGGRRYNMMGQPVGDDYKGIVVEDGEKKVVK